MAKMRVLVTGAAGYIASQMLPTFRERYDLVLVDVTDTDRDGNSVEGVVKANLIDPDRSGYEALFQGRRRRRPSGLPPTLRRGHRPLLPREENVEMAYNVLRTSYDSGVGRVAMASSNHAADWYEHALIHRRKMEVLDPYALPLSDNFYGWAKATYEHMGFVFACGFPGFQDLAGREYHTSGLTPGRRMGAVMVRIGAPRELRLGNYEGAVANFKRDLGAYISPRDITQLFVKSIETPNIDNEHGIPWQVVYGISNNTRAFWSLANARSVLGYEPEDDAEVKFAEDVAEFKESAGADAASGRVGLPSGTGL